MRCSLSRQIRQENKPAASVRNLICHTAQRHKILFLQDIILQPFQGHSSVQNRTIYRICPVNPVTECLSAQLPIVNRLPGKSGNLAACTDIADKGSFFKDAVSDTLGLLISHTIYHLSGYQQPRGCRARAADISLYLPRLVVFQKMSYGNPHKSITCRAQSLFTTSNNSVADASVTSLPISPVNL